MQPQLERLGTPVLYLLSENGQGKKLEACGLYDREGLEGKF